MYCPIEKTIAYRYHRIKFTKHSWVLWPCQSFWILLAKRIVAAAAVDVAAVFFNFHHSILFCSIEHFHGHPSVYFCVCVFSAENALRHSPGRVINIFVLVFWLFCWARKKKHKYIRIPDEIRWNEEKTEKYVIRNHRMAHANCSRIQKHIPATVAPITRCKTKWKKKRTTLFFVPFFHRHKMYRKIHIRC